VPLKDYQEIILDSFRDRHTPASFEPTTAKLSALSKNWLTQQTVSRQVVLLLGFGLGMSTEDVNDFLYKALHEAGLNMLDPLETICFYCYEHGYGYYKFEQLRQQWQELKPEEAASSRAGEEIRPPRDDAELMACLRTMKGEKGTSRAAEASYAAFMKLYEEARKLIAEQYNREAGEENKLRVNELREQMDRNDRLYEEEKQERIRKAEGERKQWIAEEITESDLEHILCSAIPTDRHGNLVPAKKSTLNRQFEGKRFSRKHLNMIIHREKEVERFDLITMNFLIHSEKTDRTPNAKKRYIDYIESTNGILESCGMGPLYVANPYECFVLMCILSVSPLETYADVMEMSYGEGT
jgi:hypothetical protein